MNHTMNALSALLQRNEGEAKADDYTGEDGLLHCGKCHAPRQMHAPDYIRKTTGESVVWIPCDCEANERATLRQQREQERREQQLRTLKVNGFSDVSMESWNFRNDNGRNPQMGYARNYVTQWRDFEREISACCCGARWAPARVFCRVHRKCADGAGHSRLHDEL